MRITFLPLKSIHKKKDQLQQHNYKKNIMSSEIYQVSAKLKNKEKEAVTTETKYY